MYTPYNQQNLQHPQPFHTQPSNLPQQQYQQQGQFQQPQGTQPQQNAPYTFFNDPTAAMAAQFARTGLDSSNQYLQQNLGSFMSNAGDLHYYFQVSNSYVVRKILLVLFPYRNKNWSRLTTTVDGSSSTQYLPPSHDTNAPDLYIPLMAFITYILLWSCFQGLKGDFHPQLFGYLASQTLACSFLDILFFRVGLYLLNCSTNSSLWDLISFSGYKYVAIIVLLVFKHLVGSSWMFYYSIVLAVTISLSLFLMRSLKFMVLPSTTNNTVSAKQRRIRVQFLFLYAVVLQFLIILFMSR
ncbi:hypothetical protein PGUG_01614 [Meyerozyma guilliermondii ATCC 6260]|uniref:Protein YIF1 n=1 Tax=Meyerozyma guilliermondii (strain ATCC 6260 / CBS 566 / DSM 6381 / JCM 1539 / NBRC 10279 / NRRL Y-324) TaxID=294746 RepID=A5DEB3_PICGU|nr:uncharacterized protein PGUG_01614 [Meyerozyma guilliermondii ATCC 6260]EDK37516.2 hypothetical protein PGUG_01614 [Meyerozyma guilliermondii ATCC 6260]